MAFACCQLCYETYLWDNNGTVEIDVNAVEDAIIKLNPLSEEDKEHLRTNLCMCECHMEGCNILH